MCEGCILREGLSRGVWFLSRVFRGCLLRVDRSMMLCAKAILLQQLAEQPAILVLSSAHLMAEPMDAQASKLADAWTTRAKTPDGRFMEEIMEVEVEVGQGWWIKEGWKLDNVTAWRENNIGEQSDLVE